MKTLSDFFPSNTIYFYGYPSGEASGFVNKVTPDVEEIVAARANTCAGDNITVLNFAATIPNEDNIEVFKAVGLPQRSTQQVMIMPEKITYDIRGAERNELVKEFLRTEIQPGSLIMAQPFLDEDVRSAFQVDPRVTAWLNDKKNMMEYINNQYLPGKYGIFNSGQELIDALQNIPTPVVIKVTSSSAGDGVYLCYDQNRLEETAQALSDYHGSITAEQFVAAKYNCGLQFGVKPTGDIELISVSEQITTIDGEFLGGVIKSNFSNPGVDAAKIELLEKILPYVYEKGWHGIGCFDVLIDEQDNPYFIDANFRMTGMTASIFYRINDTNPQAENLLSLGAVYEGTKEDFMRDVAAISTGQEGWLHILTLSQNDTIWRFNACFYFSDEQDLKEKCAALSARNLQSKIFEEI